MNLAPAVASLAFDAITIERRVGSYVNGVWTPSVSPTSLPIRASIQPINGRDIERLPEGRRSKAAIAIYTTTPLLLDDVATSQMADVITWRGKRWQVDHVESWDTFGYVRALATQEDA